MAALFRRNFEEGMLAFYQARPGEVSGLLREMAQSFAKFTPGPDNYYIQVLRWAATGRSQAVIVIATLLVAVGAEVWDVGPEHERQAVVEGVEAVTWASVATAAAGFSTAQASDRQRSPGEQHDSCGGARRWSARGRAG